MAAIGETKMSYPGNDPENGPAHLQRWTGERWECAAHSFRTYTEQDIDDEGKPTGEEYTVVACRHCGELQYDMTQVEQRAYGRA